MSSAAATTDALDAPWPDRDGGRPAPLGRFRARGALEVRARRYSGSRCEAGEIARWVEQLSDCLCTTRAEPDGWVVEVQDPATGCLELNPGHVLVWTRSTRRWAVCSPSQFGAWFEPTPRELPVFSDGEVAE